jgi:predicted component of type VI protein secretion system
MSNINANWRVAAAAVVAAATLAGCNGGGGTVPPSTGAPSPPAQVIDFSVFAAKAFAANADSAPVGVDGVNFTFDVNNDPSAFDALIMSGTFQ